MERNFYKIPNELGGGLAAFSTNYVINKTVKVVDEFGDPLPGAHVYFGPNAGTTTDFNGVASLSGVGPQEVTVSYVGFKPQRFVFGSLPSTVKLTMDSDLGKVIIKASAAKKAAATESQVPMYLFPAIGGIALLLILMSMGSPAKSPKEINL